MAGHAGDTDEYYRLNAEAYVSATRDVDMAALHARFLRHVPAGGLILDAGCGSGRDSKAFLDQGFRIDAFDASAEMAARAAQLIRRPVTIQRFEDFEADAIYDGIWACASLLHVREAILPSCLSRLAAALKPGGILYLSFKHGSGERIAEGRHFTDSTEARLRTWLATTPELDVLTCWTTQDARPERTEVWINALVRREAPHRKLVTGGPANPLLPQLSAAMAQATEIDVAVAFIKTTGLRLLLPEIHAVLDRSHEVRIRILTSDYLDVTDPDALRLLLLLQQRGAQARVFQAATGSLHLKAYLFARIGDRRLQDGVAFVGSSNISRIALTEGLEWNYRIEFPSDPGLIEARARFEELFADHRTVALTDTWIAAYEARRVPSPHPAEPGSLERDPPPDPKKIQLQALAALAATRTAGFQRGLVVLATGLGKTWLAAFDARAAGAKRVLFIAHREEILAQAAGTFVRIWPSAKVGLYVGKAREADVDVLCGSIQTLGRAAHLERFDPRTFDYIVVDEFHHAAAPAYRRLLAHFQPRFLLGLTATPDRTDRSDILSLCDDNLVFECPLFQGIKQNELAPFHYFGIWDETVDYREIPWRNGRFDIDELTTRLATEARAGHALEQWRQRRQTRTLAFCVSIRHAEYMAEYFAARGVRAAAVYAGSRMGRAEALAQLNDGRLDVIFSVDLFNEGVDLPGIDTVMMLRPTESKILFLQQLGRGLRCAPGKAWLVVLDFVGNHQSFLARLQAIAQLGSSQAAMAQFVSKAEHGGLVLPPGCFINVDLALIGFLKSLKPRGLDDEYATLKATLGRRPTLLEFYRSGAGVAGIADWFAFVDRMGDLPAAEAVVAQRHDRILVEMQKTALTRSFKMILMEAFQELDGWRDPPTLAALARRSWDVLQRRRVDLPDDAAPAEDGRSARWQAFWRRNPVNAWIGGNRPAAAPRFFELRDDHFRTTQDVAPEQAEVLGTLVQELIDYRLATYEARSASPAGPVT